MKTLPFKIHELSPADVERIGDDYNVFCDAMALHKYAGMWGVYSGVLDHEFFYAVKEKLVAMGITDDLIKSGKYYWEQAYEGQEANKYATQDVFIDRLYKKGRKPKAVVELTFKVSLVERDNAFARFLSKAIFFIFSPEESFWNWWGAKDIVQDYKKRG